MASCSSRLRSPFGAASEKTRRRRAPPPGPPLGRQARSPTCPAQPQANRTLSRLSSWPSEGSAPMARCRGSCQRAGNPPRHQPWTRPCHMGAASLRPTGRRRRDRPVKSTSETERVTTGQQGIAAAVLVVSGSVHNEPRFLLCSSSEQSCPHGACREHRYQSRTYEYSLVRPVVRTRP